jgi:tetratricopeptide (TPR) repeat protein
MASSDPAQAELWISQAIAANPRDAGLRVARAAFLLARPSDQQDRRQIRTDYDAALSLDPQNLRARVAYADVLASWDDRAGTVEQYRLAIKTNEGLHPDEPDRLSPAELERIRSRLTALGGG